MFVGIFMLVFVLLCATFGSYFIGQLKQHKENCLTEGHITCPEKIGHLKNKKNNPFEM